MRASRKQCERRPAAWKGARAWPRPGLGRGFRGRALRGFTLIELLTVIAIIGIIAGLIFPAISALTKSNRVEAGMNTLSVAVAAGRALATRPVGRETKDATAAAEPGGPFARDLDFVTPGVQTAQPPAGPGYRGVALLFTPSNEIRVVRHTDWAFQEHSPYTALALNAEQLCGFEDYPGWDYIRIPKGVGVVGLTRGNNGLIVLPPPFAVRFDRDGKVINGRPTSNRDRIVFYNGNYSFEPVSGSTPQRPTFEIRDSQARYSRTRSTTDPDTYDPDSPQYDSSVTWAQGTSTDPIRKYTLPFEAVDTVIGVVLYDKNTFRGQFGRGWPAYNQVPRPDQGTPEDNPARWVLENGKTVFFNRYTGAMME